jgi:hypothetical protein
MVENNPPAPPDLARPPVISLPIALYVSGELIFELYDGGQPCRRFSIRWERLVPGKESEPEAAAQSSQAVLYTHQD